MFPTPNSDPGKKRPFKINLWWMYAIVLLFLLGIYYLDDNSVTRTVSYSDFESYVVKDHGIRTRRKRDYTEDPRDITEAMRGGKVAYLVNTRDPSSAEHVNAGFEMRRLAIENSVTTFTSLDTVSALLDVLEAISSRISTIDAQ